MVVALLFALFSRRFSARACFWTIALGSAAIIASIVWPQIITPFNFGVEAEDVSAKSYKFIRAFFGIAATTGFGMLFLLLDWRRTDVPETDLGWWGIGRLMEKFKGAPIREVSSRTVKGIAMLALNGETLTQGVDAAGWLDVGIGRELADDLGLELGDIVFLFPPGLRKFGRIGVHARIRSVEHEGRCIRVRADVLDRLMLKPGGEMKIQAIISKRGRAATRKS